MAQDTRVAAPENGQPVATATSPLCGAVASHAAACAENARLREALEQELVERQRAEEAQAKAKAELEAARATAQVIENMPDPLIVLDLNGVVISVNPAYTRMCGRKREETIGKGFAEFVERLGAEDIERFTKLLGSLVETGHIEPVETVLGTKDGSEIPISVAYSLIKDAEGNPKRIVAVLRDITQLKRGDEALRESREYYDRIIETIPSSLLTIDRQLRVVSANRNFLAKARRSESATIGRRIEEVFSPAVLTYSKLEERITRVFQMGEPFSGGQIERLPGLPGRVYFYRLSPLRGEDGAVKNVVLLMDDVTEQKRLSEEVRHADRHLASVVDSANDLVVSMDAEGRILTWNRAAERASGFRSEEVKGLHLSDLCVDEGQQSAEEWLRQFAMGQFAARSREVDLRTKEGEEVPISWACSRILDDERCIVGLVAVGRDLTERKRMEAQLITSAKLTSLGVMAGGIAHEIRNPLAISSAAAQLLLERPDDGELRREAAEKIWSGIQRASYIIENLLRFARPPQERTIAVDIAQVVEETISLLANQLTLQQVEVHRDLAAGVPPIIGNRGVLQQVFSNMILNACNAMPDGGTLTVTTRAISDEEVEIQFTDTGCGIPDEILGEIFDPFFTTMPVGKGTGLGLSISYSIIREHHGTIDVESKVGEGSTFTIRLPVTSDRKENIVD